MKNYGKNTKSYKDKNTKNERPMERLPENDECLAVGRNAVKELLSGERDIEKIYVQRGEVEGSIKVLIAMARERKIPISELEKQKLDSMARGLNHQGIIAIASERNYSSIEEIISYAEEKGEKPFVILLDGVEDPHNLGAIIRSAECCGAHGVIIPKRRAVGLTPVVSRASAGAVEHMRVAKVTNLASTVDELKELGFWIYGADMGGKEYYATDFSGAVCLVLGSEGFGISRLVREKCDFIVSIPLYGNVNSMNVSCAGAVLFAEIAKQKHQNGGK